MAISHRERRRAAERPSVSSNGKRPVGAPKLNGGITGKGFVKGQRRGAPNGNQNHVTHGLIAFERQVKRRTRRGRSLIDRRSAAGKNAVAIGDQLLADLGGEENCSTAKLMLIEMVRRDVYFCDEIDKRIFRYLYKVGQDKDIGAKAKASVKLVSMLYGYRQGVVNNLSRNLQALGLEKAPPKVKSLEEILAEDEPEGQDKESP